MKRFLSFLLLALAVVMLAGCDSTADNQDATADPASANSDGAQAYQAKIIQKDSDTVLLVAQEEQAGAPTLCRLPLKDVQLADQQGKRVAVAALIAGMTVDVSYDGTVLETYPAQLAHVVKIQITGQGEDMVGFYCGVLQDLYGKDPALNHDISMLAFDLTAVHNLTTAEKEALVWLAGKRFQLETMAATAEELTKQGLIDPEEMYFTNGLLVKIEDEPMKNGSFSFSANKWRSGLGAYYFTDCTAKKEDKQWYYTVGSEMIS